MWVVTNRITGAVHRFKNLRRAMSFADKKDNEYGAVICSVYYEIRLREIYRHSNVE